MNIPNIDNAFVMTAVVGGGKLLITNYIAE